MNSFKSKPNRVKIKSTGVQFNQLVYNLYISTLTVNFSIMWGFGVLGFCENSINFYEKKIAKIGVC